MDDGGIGSPVLFMWDKAPIVWAYLSSLGCGVLPSSGPLHLAPAHLAQPICVHRPLGPAPVWAQGPFAQGPFGPRAHWAQGPGGGGGGEPCPMGHLCGPMGRFALQKAT